MELYSPRSMRDYARLTGWILARAHARSGDPALLSGYIGGGQTLADANLLKIEFTYGVPLTVPLAGRLGAWVMRKRGNFASFMIRT